VTDLSELFLSGGGRAMVDLDALFEASRPVFDRLGWLVIVFELAGSVAKVRCVMKPPGKVLDFAEVPPPTTREVPLDALPGLKQLVERGVGYFDDRPLDYEDGMAKWATATGREPAAFGEFLVRNGLTRGAWVPALVRGEVAFVVGAMSHDLAQHDFAAVQLFASQISATVQIAALTDEVGKQHKLAALGQMSGLLAHEVRNPLAVMFQAYRQIRRRVGDKAEIGDLMDIVEEEAWRLNHLVDDLVHFAGPIKPRLKDVSLGQLVRWAIEGLSADAGVPSSKIDIHVDVPPNLSPVIADPMLLRQAISHLVDNACAHVRRGGNVWISGEEDELNRRVRLKVVNDGAPLPEEVAYRVFEPFFTTKAKGTGLGLAVVRRLIEDQRGKVVLDPTEQGVSFSLWLPMSQSRPV
jgi:signal transduction histidine kinase